MVVNTMKDYFLINAAKSGRVLNFVNNGSEFIFEKSENPNLIDFLSDSIATFG